MTTPAGTATPSIAATIEARRAAIAARHPRWLETTLDDYFRDAASVFGTRDLVVTDQETLSYAACVEQSGRIATALDALGLQRGDRVGIIMPNLPIVVPLLFALWRLGLVAVPVNTLYRADELSYVLNQSRCRFLVTVPAFNDQDYLAHLDRIVPGWRKGDYAPLHDLIGVAVHGAGAGLAWDFATMMAKVPHSAPLPPNRAQPHDPAVIMYTSGTTGPPKGVVQSHDNLLRAAYAGAYHKGFTDGRRAIFSLPLYHAFGLVVGLLSGLVVGGAIIPLPKFDADKILRAIQRHRATYLMGVPTMTLALMEQAQRAPYDLSSLTTIHSAAAPTPSWVWRDIKSTLGCDEIFTSYGQTETTATIICTRPGDPIETVAAAVGIPVIGGIAAPAGLEGRIAEFKTIDPLTGADLPFGATGEICTRGPLNSKGYFERQEDTAKLFIEGGWLRTGDLGFFRDDGNLYLTGRVKELYKSGGEMVSPKEVEEVLTSHPKISQAYVVGVPDERWGESGSAWIVAAEGQAPDAAEIIAYLQTRLARFKIPRDVHFITASELPKTGTGKVQKAVLQARAIALATTAHTA